MLIAVAICVTGALLWIGSSRAAAHAFDRGSASNTSPTGLSLAYAYLGHGRSVGMLMTPLRDGVVPPNAVILRVDSERATYVTEEEDLPAKTRRTPESLLTPAEDEFVRNGGRLVLATADPGGSVEARHDAGKVAARVFPIWPGLETLSLPEPRGFAPRSLPRGMHTLFAANGQTIVARQEIGAGDVILISVPEMFENQNLPADHHLAFLTALTDQRPIYFDELVHGLEVSDGAMALLKEWRLGPLLLLAGVAALLALWRNGRRIGRPDLDDRDMRSDAIDLVASLGALYGRSMSDAEAIALYHQSLERTVAAQSRLRGDALRRRVDELTHGMRRPAAAESLAAHAFKRNLTIINEAFRTLERTAGGKHDANHR
jgi:hypothetical protein